MGGDGGTKSLQRKFLRSAQIQGHSEKASKSEILAMKWSTCHLSGEPLQEPIVACKCGFLYNKEAILSAIIEKRMPEELKHIRKLKDLIELKLCPNPTKKSGEGSIESFWSTSTILNGAFYCPITMVEMNGLHPFSVIQSCGCVISDKALKEVPSPTCLRCGKDFSEVDVYKINPPDDVVSTIRAELVATAREEKLLRKSSKGEEGEERKSKKDKTRHGEDGDGDRCGGKKAKVDIPPKLESKASLIAREAERSIAAAKASNPLLQSLVHKSDERGTYATGGDLMMRTATLRYGL
jgi:hypothetical protein